MNRGLTVCLIFLTAIALHADVYSDLFREAAACTQQGKYDQAIVKYRAALLIRPGAPEALNNLALMYYELERYSEAFETASKIWAGHPELRSAALIAGMAAVQLTGRRMHWPRLSGCWSGCFESDALLALASAHLALNDFSEAAQSMNAKPNIRQPIRWLGMDVPSATKIWRRALRDISRRCQAGRLIRSVYWPNICRAPATPNSHAKHSERRRQCRVVVLSPGGHPV